MAGVAIDSIYDMRTLFSGIPLDQMTVSMTMNGAVLPILALYIVAAEEQGVAPRKLAGTIQNDILKEFMVRNTYIYPPAPSMRIISDIFAYTSQQHAEVQLDLDLRLPHAGGRSDGRSRTRLHARRRRRIRPRRHRRRARHRRVRAAPVVLLGDRHELLHGGRQDARRAPAVGEAHRRSSSRRTAARCRCARTPDVGLVAHRAGRVQQRDPHLLEAMAATQGHTQSLHTNALDEALALPTDFSARIARNTQLSCSRRAAPAASIDPWGGRHYVERLTSDLAHKALGAHRGGRGARRHGQGHRGRHPETAYRGGRRPHSGAHRLRPPDDRRRQQVPRRRTRPRSTSSRSTTPPCAASRSRSSKGCAASATRPSRARSTRSPMQRRGNGNLLELAVAAARAKATVGEISDAWRRC